jgi:hypothetical protein
MRTKKAGVDVEQRVAGFPSLNKTRNPLKMLAEPHPDRRNAVSNAD